MPAHKRDLGVRGRHGVSYQRYWFDEASSVVFCLVEAPDAEAAATVHREAHAWCRRDHAGARGQLSTEANAR